LTIITNPTILTSSVAEPHNFYAAPAPGENFDAAPAPAPSPTLMYSKAKILKQTKVHMLKRFCTIFIGENIN
jgi:hypothetical protein